MTRYTKNNKPNPFPGNFNSSMLVRRKIAALHPHINPVGQVPAVAGAPDYFMDDFGHPTIQRDEENHELECGKNNKMNPFPGNFNSATLLQRKITAFRPRISRRMMVIDCAGRNPFLPVFDAAILPPGRVAHHSWLEKAHQTAFIWFNEMTQNVKNNKSKPFPRNFNAATSVRRKITAFRAQISRRMMVISMPCGRQPSYRHGQEPMTCFPRRRGHFRPLFTLISPFQLSIFTYTIFRPSGLAGRRPIGRQAYG